MSSSRQPIGIFDSGVGGLTVLRKMVDLLPNEHFIYLGDTARVPYGNKSPETIRAYALQCAQFLLDRSVKLIIVACNTVSAVALNQVAALSRIPVIGMINPGARAAIQASPNGRIGIIGTQATVQSKAYEIEIHRLATLNSFNIYAQACPLFVPLAEEGWHLHPATQLIVNEYLAPLKEAEVEALVLGCTHYPLLKTIIADYMPKVTLIDSGEEAAVVAQQLLHEQGEASISNHHARAIDCYVTDMSPFFSLVAHRLLGFTLDNVQQVMIDQLAKNTVADVSF